MEVVSCEHIYKNALLFLILGQLIIYLYLSILWYIWLMITMIRIVLTDEKGILKKTKRSIYASVTEGYSVFLLCG